MTGNVRDNCYPHIRLLPTHLHLASADFIRLLPTATSAHPLFTHSPIPFCQCSIALASQVKVQVVTIDGIGQMFYKGMTNHRNEPQRTHNGP